MKRGFTTEARRGEGEEENVAGYLIPQ